MFSSNKEKNKSLDEAKVPWNNKVKEDYHVTVFEDKYPVTNGHLLFVPNYNTVGVLRDVLEDAIKHGIEQVENGNWDGFNIGMNVGEAAGQTVPWPHIHVIPRRKGDMEDPRGGVRHVIPEKGNYRK